jgi:glycosyltransferase involved in cell wall biosynthesis
LGKRVYVDVQRVPKGQMRYYKHVGILRACSPLIEKLIKVEFPKELASKVSYIPNPVPFDIKEFQVEKKKNVLFVGRLNKEKGVEILIDAFKKVDARVSKDWKLIIVGPSDVRDGGSGPEYLSLLKEKSIGIDVLFVGPVFDEIQLAKYYAESKIFCYPAQKGSGDAAPVAPREAMAYGCATVVSKLECFNDIIVDGVNGIQFDENPDTQVNELSDVFAELFNDPEKIDKLSVQARNVIQMYSSPIIAKQFLNDFKKLDF